ncbi:PepSY domain-containing protein [Sulfurirhabdus autotrophica]|uniref:Peptidase YpeB-like protein n=1 Tax=Sulfurirhabdus autotrophica TaxID=1706046 RepID=A0A4R3Y3P9_9PROT|nr:PepSY domain-containing protein [Sulfurirhabdus autotrophica]TCV85368.1 peptidase YpeB-like protein [Sulfurirhabdus autotrophica]
MKHIVKLVVLSVLSAAAIGTAFAAKSLENDALAVTAAKVSITQAIAAAEQHVGGKASRAEYERAKGQYVFDIEVVKDKNVMDVEVDPTSGKVIAAVEDKNDHDDHHDRAD